MTVPYILASVEVPVQYLTTTYSMMYAVQYCGNPVYVISSNYVYRDSYLISHHKIKLHATAVPV